MASCFGDTWDLYAAIGDMTAGYWDSGTLGTMAFVAGRFAGSQALAIQSATNLLAKSSGANDAVHHITVAFRQTAALSGTTLAGYLQLTDNVTNQCCIVFRSDGAILLTSATPAGTVLDTYTSAVTANNTWFSFEFEVVISNTTGSWAVRKNGNTSNDHALGSLNTRPGTNSYANKLTLGVNAALAAQQFDDLLWRSDAASVPWVGDIRGYLRMPASDAAVQFARSIGASNASCVDDVPQTGATDYVYDSTVNDADFYAVTTLVPQPAAVIAVTVRGFMTKGDTGARTGTVQLKSGAATVAAPTATLTASFGWAWRTDTTDPATSTAWSASAVDAATIGPRAIS